MKNKHSRQKREENEDLQEEIRCKNPEEEKSPENELNIFCNEKVQFESCTDKYYTVPRIVKMDYVPARWKERDIVVCYITCYLPLHD